MSAGLDLREQRADLLLQRVQNRGLIEDDGELIRFTEAGRAVYDTLLDKVVTASTWTPPATC